MLPILLWLAVQDEPIGWTCNVEKTEDGLVYVAEQSIEGGDRFPRKLRAKWMRGPFNEDAFVEWNSMNDPLPGTPGTINFRVPLSKRVTKLTLRVEFPGAHTEEIARTGRAWRISLNLSTDFPSNSKRPVASFQNVDRDVNRKLWTARHFRAVVVDKHGQELGMRAVDLPDPAALMQLYGELGRALDAKLDDAPKQCSGYGPEVYLDPAPPPRR